MAISVRCKQCKSDHKLGIKKCPRCGALLGKKQNRVYRVVISVRKKRYSRVVPTLEIARELESKWKDQVNREEYDLYSRKKSVTLNDVWTRYFKWVKENRKSWYDIGNVYKNHLSHLGDYSLKEIDAWHVELIASKMRKAGKAPATIRKVINILSGIFTKARQWKMYTGKNPCFEVEKPKPNNQLVRYLTWEQEASLLDVLDKWPDPFESGFVKVLLSTGLRRGEAFKLTWRDIDLENKTILLRDPKGKQDVTLPLASFAVRTFKRIPRTESEFVFPGKSGGQRTDFKRPWYKIREAAGIPKNFRLHDLRHNFATKLVSHGVDLYAVSKLLGHKDVKTTQRYAHLADKALRESVNRLDEAMDRKAKQADVVHLGKVGDNG